MQVALPHSQVSVELRPPGGREDVMLRESARFDRRLALEILKRIATPAIDLSSLTVHEFELLLLHIHRMLFGDRVIAESSCACGENIDIEFRVSEYLADKTPRKRAKVSPAKESGWFEIKNTPISFRLPTIGDQIAVQTDPNPIRALIDRCVQPPEEAGRAMGAMESMAPALSAPVEGRCPHCGNRVQLMFDVLGFVLRELAAQASAIYEEIHLLASAYHWSEERILDLPPDRRREYAEMIRAGR